MKKKIIVPLLLLLAVAVYFTAFHKDKDLLYIPDNADAVVLIDTKKLAGQYFFSWLTHPSEWSGNKTEPGGSGSLRDSGIRIPDFLQIFHMKDHKLSEWYSVLELNDPQRFIAFLKKQKFDDKGNNHFQKDQIFLSIDGNHCIAGTSDLAFEMIHQQLFQRGSRSARNAGELIQNSVGSISFVSGQKIHSFSIELRDDEMVIGDDSGPEVFQDIDSEIKKGNHFLQLELDRENLRMLSRFFSKSMVDSSQAISLKAAADLAQINDTIISYGYDDQFNEIEKKTFQKIIQPGYTIRIESRNAGKILDYFRSEKWINSENQFTAIPFQPNKISQNNNSVVIQSARNPIPLFPQLKENYILIRNTPLLYSSLKTLSKAEKKIISDIDYVLYRNRSGKSGIKIKAKKGELPLILRW